MKLITQVTLADFSQYITMTKEVDKQKSIPVTRPFLPPIEDYQEYLQQIWDRAWLTNNGPVLLQLEAELKNYLKLQHLAVVSNGTVAIQIAIRALNIRGKVITTPFTYIATSSSIVWEHCQPVFCDICADDFNIDPDKIEDLIDVDTTAIIATHVFGAPCAVDRIHEIASRYDLKVIYDAAHAFDVTYGGKSLLGYGDLSTISFHATKTFNTVEGGAVTGNNPELMEQLRYLRNFGHHGPYVFERVGINGKMSELHAAMGLCNLKYIDTVIDERKRRKHLYLQLLDTSKVTLQRVPQEVENSTYMPILLKDEKTLKEVEHILANNHYGTRRYFYPPLHQLPFLTDEKTQLSVTEDISSRILCLPLYSDLEIDHIEKISKLVNHNA